MKLGLIGEGLLTYAPLARLRNRNSEDKRTQIEAQLESVWDASADGQGMLDFVGDTQSDLPQLDFGGKREVLDTLWITVCLSGGRRR